jgi:hypothetical protein
MGVDAGLDGMTGRVAAGRSRTAEVFLAFDESRYITGVSLPVDAGSLLK